MKYLIILYILLCTASYVKCQEIQVFSADEKEIVFPATIFFMINDSIVGGSFVDESGKAFIELNNEVNFIEIKSVGYQSQKIAIKDIASKIYLKNEVVELDEVVISDEIKKNKKNKLKYLGYPIKYRNISWHITSGFEMVTLIENKLQKSKRIKSFLFRLVGYGENSTILNIVLYKNENGKIGNSLLKTEQVIILTSKQKQVRLDLSHLNLKIPKEGVFVGFEYIGCIDPKTNKKILANEEKDNSFARAVSLLKTKQKNTITYARNKFNEYMKEWISASDKKISLSELLKENQYFVPAFGIEVYE